MNVHQLTKEEVKAVKRGHAYRTWRRTTWAVSIINVVWIFFSIPLYCVNSTTSFIAFCVNLVLIGIATYVLRVSSWKCPACKGKLPSMDFVKGQNMPVIVLKCPHCGEDLTQ